MTLQILDDTIIVQLDQRTTNSDGLLVPKFDAYSLDDGRLKTKISDDVFSTTGTVRQTGLKYDGILRTGDKVVISNPAVSKYHFNPESSTHYTGLIKVPQSLIDGKIIPEEVSPS